MSSVIVMVSVSTSCALTAVIQRWIAASSATRTGSGAASATLNVSKPLTSKTANGAARQRALFMYVVTHELRDWFMEEDLAKRKGPAPLPVRALETRRLTFERSHW